MSRRQQQLQPPQPPTAVELPLHIQQQQQQMGSHQRSTKRRVSDTAYLQSNPIIAGGANLDTASSPLPLPPRSGQLGSAAASLMENIEDFMNYGAPKKKKSTASSRKFHVDVPRRLLVILAMIFLIAPLIIFLHKEAHIHEDHDEGHFKAEKFVNVDTESILSQFRVNVTKDESLTVHNATQSSDTKEHLEKVRRNENPPPNSDVDFQIEEATTTDQAERIGNERDERTTSEVIAESDAAQILNTTTASSVETKLHSRSNSTDLGSTAGSDDSQGEK